MKTVCHQRRFFPTAAGQRLDGNEKANDKQSVWIGTENHPTVAKRFAQFHADAQQGRGKFLRAIEGKGDGKSAKSLFPPAMLLIFFPAKLSRKDHQAATAPALSIRAEKPAKATTQAGGKLQQTSSW
ncbi:MAG TPA: hypothetical protein IAC36_09460 [Candidatus Aphodomonas merdavium]|nr:hypothetical protein [Candidatus Aphodomonas merdavium]